MVALRPATLDQPPRTVDAEIPRFAGQDSAGLVHQFPDDLRLIGVVPFANGVAKPVKS